MKGRVTLVNTLPKFEELEIDVCDAEYDEINQCPSRIRVSTKKRNWIHEWFCTRSRGHLGQHHAHYTDIRYTCCCRWEQ